MELYNEHIDKSKLFISKHVATNRLAVDERYFDKINGEGIHLAYVGKTHYIEKKPLLKYLENHHYRGRKEGEPEADCKCKHREELTNDRTELTDIPCMYDYHKLALQLGMEHRYLLSQCEQGIIPHYRIGTMIRIAHDDLMEAINNISKKPSETDEKAKGRPNVFYEKLNAWTAANMEFVLGDLRKEKRSR